MKASLLAVLLVVFPSTPAVAVPLTFEFEGMLDFMEWTGPVTLQFEYDSETPDRCPNGGPGLYDIASASITLLGYPHAFSSFNTLATGRCTDSGSLSVVESPFASTGIHACHP